MSKWLMIFVCVLPVPMQPVERSPWSAPYDAHVRDYLQVRPIPTRRADPFEGATSCTITRDAQVVCEYRQELPR